MKTTRVVAAIICDDMNAPSRIFATARGYGVKASGNFPAVKSRQGRLRKMHFIEKSERNWIPRSKLGI